jgi:hypothetical protein
MQPRSGGAGRIECHAAATMRYSPDTGRRTLERDAAAAARSCLGAARGVSVIVESNFSADLSCQPLRDLQTSYQAAACQVLCFGDAEVIAPRFLARIESGERHPGHGDPPTLHELRRLIGTGRAEQLCLEGHVIELDTTDFSTLNPQALARTISDLWPAPLAAERA